MAEKPKTTPQAVTGKKPNWRCGAPAGNRNAAKPVTPLSQVQRQVRDLQRRIRAALRQSRACTPSAKQPQ